MRLVVCAAIRNGDTVVCGPRHGDCIDNAIGYGIYPSDDESKWECGFVDQEQVFMTREEAWDVADAAGLIRCPTGWERDHSQQRLPGIGDHHSLFSENLYCSL